MVKGVGVEEGVNQYGQVWETSVTQVYCYHYTNLENDIYYGRQDFLF